MRISSMAIPANIPGTSLFAVRQRSKSEFFFIMKMFPTEVSPVGESAIFSSFPVFYGDHCPGELSDLTLGAKRGAWLGMANLLRKDGFMRRIRNPEQKRMFDPFDGVLSATDPSVMASKIAVRSLQALVFRILPVANL